MEPSYESSQQFYREPTVAEGLDYSDTPLTVSGRLLWKGYSGGDEYMGRDYVRVNTDTNESIVTVVYGPGPVSFASQLDSPSSLIKLQFYVDGQLLLDRPSHIWSLNEVNLSSGQHTLKWELHKSDPNNPLAATAWLDRLYVKKKSPPPMFLTAPGQFLGWVDTGLHPATNYFDPYFTSSPQIFYTLNGTQATTNSTLWGPPYYFHITTTTTVRAVSLYPGMLPSDELIGTFQIVPRPVNAPAISPNGGTFANQCQVFLGNGNPQAKIYYTLDGSNPTNASLLYQGPFLLTDNRVVKAIACEENQFYSSITSATFHVAVQWLSEAVDNNLITSWTSTGDPWNRYTSVDWIGGDAAKSGLTSSGQISGTQISLQGPGTVGFYWKVSTEPGYDYLRVLVGEVEKARITGNQDWSYVSIELPYSNTYNVRWEYCKTGYTPSDMYAGWIDYVTYTGSGDGDHLPDEWELRYFGNLGQDDTGDPDQDGANNVNELNNGTNPTLKEYVQVIEELPKAIMTATASTTAPGTLAQNAIDGSILDAGWSSAGLASGDWLQIDLHTNCYLSRIQYYPRAISAVGTILQYSLYVTNNTPTPSQLGALVASGPWTWPNGEELKTVSFYPTFGRYVTLQCWLGQSYTASASIGELWIYKNNLYGGDSDSDGLADYWETLFFGSLGQGPNSDYDGDGLSNIEEYSRGSNPIRNSSLQIYTPLRDLSH